jgi:hypothetical protein
MPKIPQRRLAYELRIAIDRCMRQPGERRFRDRLMRLIEENSDGVWSSHVQHNLGVTRRTWVDANIARPASRVVATPGLVRRFVEEVAEDGPQADQAVVANQGGAEGVVEEALEEGA